MTKLLDLGSLFGLPVRNVFAPCKQVEVLVPGNTRYNELEAFVKASDLIGFGGGADIHPSLYGCEDVASSVGPGPSHRDAYEVEAFNLAVSLGKPIFGICRGAQLACAMSGGMLVQDVGGHGGTHTLTLEDGSFMPMSSTHHQMMYPWNTDHRLLGWTENRSKSYLHSIPHYIQPTVDPEVVFFPKTSALAVQGHPEWMDPNSKPVQQVRNWITTLLHVPLN